jgi:TM2 domain-containing membrane protein YozV
MHRIIILFFPLLLCSSVSVAQGDLGEQLLRLEEKAFTAASDSERSSLYYEKVLLYIDSGIYTNNALQEAVRVEERWLPDSIRPRFLWNSALLAYLNLDTRLAIHQLRKYKATGDSSSIPVYLLEALASSDYDTVRIGQIAKANDSLVCVTCLNGVSRYQLKHKQAYTIASAIIPGSGLIANGNPGKGTVALLLNGGFIYLTSYFISNQLYFNAAGWGLGWGIKFYTGNLRLTSREADRREARKKNKLATDCELTINELVKKHPIAFKR